MVFPYPKGFHNNKVWDFFYIVLGSIVVFLLFIYLVLNKWYQSTFFGHKKGQIFFFFLFCRFFQEEKKEGRDTQTIPVVFCVEFDRNWLYI
jgi:hypothetical protein